MSKLVIEDFFINFCILCTGLFILHTCFTKWMPKEKRSYLFKIYAGICQGLFSMILMQFGIPFPGNVLIDLRCIPIMVAAQVGGPISSMITAFVIMIFRFVLYGYSTSALLNAGVIFVTGIAFGVIAKSNMKRSYKWSVMALFFALVIGATIRIVFHDPQTAMYVYIQYISAVAAATYCTQLLMAYLWKSSDAFNRLKEMSQRDFLTGLKNARSFHEEIQMAYLTAKESNEALSLLVIDIDHFKSINDTYGHQAGDEVLEKMAQTFLKSCRSMDVVCRHGGEEFFVILPACDARLASQVAERIRATVLRTVFIVNQMTQVRVTVSLGVGTITDFETTSIKQLIQSADDGVYMAKRAGRNRICVKEA